MDTFAVRCVNGNVMNKPMHMFVQEVSDGCLVRPNTDMGGPRILWEYMFETGGTVAVVFLATTSRVGPGDAMGATGAATMCDAERSWIFSRFVTT